MTASDLAHRLDSQLDGLDGMIAGAATPASAGASDLVFASDEKSFPPAFLSAARFVIAPPAYVPAAHQSVIRSTQPRMLFARALDLLYPPRQLAPGVHPSASIAADSTIAVTAEIGPNCTIGSGSLIGPQTRLGPGCHLADNVHVGANCELHAGVTVYANSRIGDRVILHSGCVLGADGFGFTPQNGRWIKFPQVGRVEIEDDVEIGANSCIDRAALGVTRIGAGTKLDNLVHIGHNCDIGRHVVIAAQTGLSGGVIVGDHAVIGGQVGVGDKARIESGVVIGSGSGVLTSKIVRPGEPLWGTPARPLKRYLEQLASLAQLPEMRAQLKVLRRRVADLEADLEAGKRP